LKNIKAKKLQIGKNSFISPKATIRGIDGDAEEIIIGDNTYIGDDVQIICNNFRIGDYSKMHHHTNVHGYNPCSIGHNAWIGQGTLIDSIAGTTIGDNCGIGAYSQLWSHIKFGDTLEGCRFLEEKKLIVGKDVWFVGHCIVSPITAADRSMALVGSVITKNMEENQIYAGSPAKSITDKIGHQFDKVSVEQKMEKMNKYLKESGVDRDAIAIVEKASQIKQDDKTYFILEDRTYTKNLSDPEIEFMNFLLPEKGKFSPRKV
jgi:acetyltransferase-like isoleucine patch superfamily enzyme